MKRVCRIPDRSARIQAKPHAPLPLAVDPFCCLRHEALALPVFIPDGRIARAERAEGCHRLRRHPLARYARRRSVKPPRRYN